MKRTRMVSFTRPKLRWTLTLLRIVRAAGWVTAVFGWRLIVVLEDARNTGSELPTQIWLER